MNIQPLIAPRGGLNLALPADLISELEMSNCRNVFFEDGLVKKRYGYEQLGNNLPLSGAVVGCDQFYDFKGNNWLIAITEREIYKWLPGSKTWSSIGDAANDAFGEGAFGGGVFGGGSTFSGTDEDFFSYDYARKSTETDPWWLATNKADAIKKFTGTGTISDLISTYPSGVTTLLAKYLVEFKDYVVLLDVTENGNRYPQRVRWCDTATPDDFNGGNASYQDLSGADWVVGAMKFKGDYLVIFKERSIWVGYATGDSDIFQFDQKVSGAGCAAPKTIESLGDELIFLGWDDVYVFNGIDYESIGIPIQRQLFAELNPEEIGRCFGVVIEEQKEYWLIVPSTDRSHISGSGASTYPDIAWCFNYNLNKWTRHSLSDFLTAFGYYYLEATTTFDGLTGTFDERTGQFDDRTILSSMPTTLFGDSDGYMYQYSRNTNNDDGVAIDGWFSSKDFNPTNLMQRFRVTRIDTYYTGDGLTLSYSTDKGVTWTDIATLSANSNMETPQRAWCRYDLLMVRLRWRNNTSGQHFEFSRANIFWEPAGRRL